MANWPPTNIENKGVIPAQAGIQDNIEEVDSCFRRNDKNGTFSFLRSPKLQFLMLKTMLLGILNFVHWWLFGI